MFRERNIIPQDVGEGGVAVFAFERRRAVKHFIHQDTKRPPIDSTCVPASLDDLWGNILFGPDEGVGSEVGNAGFCIDHGEL